MVPKWLLTIMSVVASFFNTGCCGAPPDPPRPQDRATPAPRSSTRCNRQKNRSQRQTRSAGGLETSPPGDGLLSPRERNRSPGRERFPTFSKAFPSRDLIFVSPVWGFNWVEFDFSGDSFIHYVDFSGDGIFSSPRGYFFRIPALFGSAVERLTLPTGQWSSLAYCRICFPLSCMFFFMTPPTFFPVLSPWGFFVMPRFLFLYSR